MRNVDTMIYTPAYKTVTIVKLLSRQKWPELAEILQNVDDRGDLPVAFDDRSAEEDRLPEEHVVHLACQNQAPSCIVERLAELFPASPATAETRGRYPIHIACAKGLKPKVVEYLLRCHPGAAGVQDDYGKTPLHYVCESYAFNFRVHRGNKGKSPEKSLRNVVMLLLDEVPTSPNVEDVHGMNPIEYALESDMDLAVIKKMQNSSRDTWRTMRRSNRGMKHEELRCSIITLGSLTISSDDDGDFRGEVKNKTKEVSVPHARINRIEARTQFARSA